MNAKDLMTPRFLRVSTEHSLREALGMVLHGEAKGYDTAGIVVIDQEGDLAGILTHAALVKGLAGEGEVPAEQVAFLQSVEVQFGKTIDDIMETEMPQVTADTPVAELIFLMPRNQFECLPVMEETRVIGLVYVSDIFRAAAQLALTPETEGIVLDG